MDKSIIVTGGAGFTGSALSHVLIKKFDIVIVIDSLLEQVHPERKLPDTLNKDVVFYEMDVCNTGLWDEILKNTNHKQLSISQLRQALPSR